jgi:hypothetical protein
MLPAMVARATALACHPTTRTGCCGHPGQPLLREARFRASFIIVNEALLDVGITRATKNVRSGRCRRCDSTLSARPIHRSHHLQFLGRRCRLHTAKDVHGYHADSATATSLLSSFLRLHPRPYRLIVRNKLRLCSGGCAIFRPLGRQRLRTMRRAQQPPSVCFGPMLSGVSEGMTALACVDFCRCPGWV